MSSIVIAGDTSGSVTLQAPATAGTTVLTLPSTSGTLSTSSGLSAATQAEMEAASSNTVAVTPLSTNWHPGVAKAWCNAGRTGNILASHNITSVTDNGVGDITVTIATDFSTTSYVTNITVGTGSDGKIVNYSDSVFVGSVRAFCVDAGGTARDPQDTWSFTCFGDQ